MFLLAISLLLSMGILNADVPNIIDFNGRLTDSSGNAVNSSVAITFNLYDVETSGTALWTETQNVDVVDGLFNAKLGSITPIDVNIIDSSELWIGISVETDDEMLPRTKIGSVPFSLRSGADGDWTISGDDVYYEDGNVGIGTTSPDEKLSVIGKIRAAFDNTETEYIEFSHGGGSSYIDWNGDCNLDFRYNTSTLVSVNQSGDIVAQGQIKNVTDPTDAQDAATKSYVDANTPITYEVGDFAQGGYVFWVDDTGQHGLVCAGDDQSSAIQWYNGSDSNTEALGNGIYAGKMNTTLIIANQGHDSNDYAAGVCASYTFVQNGRMYGDWYLPSKSELNNMYQQKAVLALVGCGFANASYWSSTETGSHTAWDQNFTNGAQASSAGKGMALHVRAIRAF